MPSVLPRSHIIDKTPGFPVNPMELKLEISRACQLKCRFCYLGKADSWQEKRFMSEKNVFHWIDWAVDNHIPGIRFTGGEAILHPKIHLFCNYAYRRKRWIILNTNAAAPKPEFDRLVFNDLRVSVPSLDSHHLDEITGKKNMLAKKLGLIEHTLFKRKKYVFMLTVLTPDLIGRLEAFIRVLQAYPGLRWVPLRYEAGPDNPRPITREQMQALAEEMSELMDRFPDHAKGICIAAPFCSVSPRKLGAKVFQGKVKNCGPHVALNVDFSGTLNACFGTCKLPGKLDLEGVRKSSRLKAVCSIEALPEECRTCEYVQICGGGCRKPETLVTHNGKQVDYLAGFADGNTESG